MNTKICENKAAITFLSILFFSFIALFFSAQKAMAVTGYAAIACPAGFYGAVKTGSDVLVCCRNGSVPAGNKGIDNRECQTTDFDIDTALIRASHSTENLFCEFSGSVILETGLVRRCFKPDSPIDGWGKNGMTFLACKSETSSSDSNGSPTTIYKLSSSKNSEEPAEKAVLSESSPEDSISVNQCYKDGGMFATKEEYKVGVCACKDGKVVTKVEDPDGSGNSSVIGQIPSEMQCSDYCGGAANIAFNKIDGSGGIGGYVALGCEDTFTGAIDEKCQACIDAGRIYTAVGCIDPSQDGLIVWLIRFAIGTIIAISILRFIQAAMMFQKADPESVEEGREIITSAIIALVLALVSIPLLSFIGVKILNIFPEGFI